MAKVSMEDFIRTIDDEPSEEVAKPKKQDTIRLAPGVESFGNVPVEDRFGQSLWVPTRECFCPNDCRFHGQVEPGWATCPYKDTGKKGRWLFAKNSNYGKNVPEVKNVD
jgi:hypothetical protein